MNSIENTTEVKAKEVKPKKAKAKGVNSKKEIQVKLNDNLNNDISISYKMDGVKLFEQMKTASSVMELIQQPDDYSKSGNIYEKLWDIVIKFGFCPELPNDVFDNYEGNVNEAKLKKVENLEVYLNNLDVLSKGAGGASDITLQNRNTGEWIFISSKYYKDDTTKSIKDYDVQDLLAITFTHQYKYKETKIYLLVKDKKKLENMIKDSQSTNYYIKNKIHTILDVNDLEVYFQNLQKAIKNISFNEINSKFCNTKIPLKMRFHQDLITHKQMQKIEEGEKELLLGAKARSGKTYCVGGVFLKYNTKYNTLNCLIITPAPTETLSQFTDDLFHKFKDFIGINIVEIRKGTDFNDMILQDKNIIIVSKQLLDDYVCEKKVDKIQNLKLDFIVFDENHFHGTTQMAKDIFTSYSSQKTIKLYLTATYAKPLNEWNIPMDCRHYWDIEDEQLCKKRNIQGLIEKHGKDVERFVNDSNKELILAVYDKMPDLHIITNMMDRKRYDIIKDQIKDTSYGFSNGTLLSTTKNGSNFNFAGEVDTMLKYITGHGTEMSVIRDEKSIFERIKKISNESNSRTKLNNGDFTTQLWFLPFGHNMLIDNVSKCLKDRMLKNHELKNYEILIVNSKKDYKVKNIKEEIKNKEMKAKEDNKTGLIILAGNQLTLGITLPFVDIVFLFNDIISSDKIVQMMYRCMTETINNDENDKINNGKKHFGFVVDLNISRVLNTLLDYNVYKKDLTLEQKITYLVENNLINIDSDLFQSKENKTQLVEKLMNIWKTDPINNLKILLRKLEENVIEIDTKDQKLLNQYFTSSFGDGKVNVKVDFDEDNQELQNGKVVVQNSDSESGDDKNGDEDEESEEKNKISLTKDVLPFIIPLSCILTIHTANMDFMEMLNIIKTNPELLCVFHDQAFIWWNKKDIITMIEKIVQKYIQKNSSIYNIAIQFKLSLQNLIDRPKELLELIDSCLKPKQKEKQENGEVFTPMTLVNEMLDKLDNHYTITNNKSIFSESGFKWFDPASGMGNFPVAVYLRLMEGLKIQFPIESERKKHIIEKMLYMSELNKKNVFICNQIFNISNEYKLNLYAGDTLEMNIETVWGIQLNTFDVVLGNPPFNKGGIRSHTGKQLGEKNETIWTKFIEKSFKWLKPDGFLVFINPLSWLKKSHSLHNEMLEKHIVWMKIWDDSKSKGTINADIPISLYILQNTLNITNKKTDIISEIQRKRMTTISNEYLNLKYTIPLAFHSIFNKLIRFIENNNCKLEYKTKTVKSTGIKTKIPLNYTPADMWAVDTYTLKEGILVKKTTEKHPDMDKRKLIISNKRGFNGAFIDEGKLSLTGNHKFYIIGDNLELILKIMNFNISVVISDYLKYGQSFLDNEAFSFIPDIRELGVNDISEDDFYELIGLTTQEIEQVKNPNNIISNDEDIQSVNSEKTEPKVKKTRVIKPKTEIKVKKTRVIKPKTELKVRDIGRVHYHDEDIMSPF